MDLFFVISGFIITHVLMREYIETNSICFRKFFIRRMLRLMPALLAMLLVYTVVAFFAFSGEDRNSRLKETFVVVTYMANWARAFEWHSPEFLGHAWSLAVEEQFYLIWPALLFLGLRLKVSVHGLIVFAVVIAVGSAAWRYYLWESGAGIDRVYNGLDTRMDGLMLGAASALALTNFGSVLVRLREMRASVSVCLRFSCLFLLIYIASDLNYWVDSRLYQGLLFFVQIICLILVVTSLVNSGRFLTVGPLSWLGKRSYGLYLWHFPVFKFINAAEIEPLLGIIIKICLTLICTVFSWRFLEVPALRLKSEYSLDSLRSVPPRLN